MAKIKFNQAQQQIIDHRQGNMIVSASAGSGKTTVMLERVMNILEEGTPIDRIVILAFNNSIAAEIRGKMYKKMVSRLGEEDCLNAEFLKEQIDRLPFCNIITNDSYCNRTSSEFFQVLGIDPKGDIIAEIEQDILFKNSFLSAVSDFKERADSKIFDLILKFGGEDSLLSQIYLIHNYVSTQSGGMEWLDKVISGVYTDNIENSSIMAFLFDMVAVRLNYSLNLLAGIVKCLDGYPDAAEPYNQYIAFFEELKKVCDYQTFYSQINAFKLVAKKRNSKNFNVDQDIFGQLHSDLKVQVEWLQGMFKKNIEQVQSLHKKTISDIKLLVELYKKTRENYTKSKQDSGKYDFSDFPSNVIKLLNNPDIRREISKRYDYICVDEYQDTNYAQEEIYTKISNGNNLFMVGDSKQSIYRFRLSEPKILLDKFEDYNQNPSHGKTKKLDFNYRSDKGIVDFANAIFNEVMTKDFGGIDYEETDQLRYGADYKIPPEQPSFEIHLFEDEKQEDNVKKTFDEVYSVRDDIPSEKQISTAYKQGLYIAEKIKQIVGTYKVYDTQIKGLREVTYSDIALLARTGKDSVREVVKAIQDNLIPIDIAPLLKEQGIYEVEIVKDILRLVVNDMQDYPLTAALVSYWVGMDYDDLVEIRQNQPQTEYFWQAVRAEKDSNSYIQKLYKMIDELRLKASYMAIKDLADCIVFDYGFDKYVLTQEGGDYKLSALKTYLASLGDLSKDISLNKYVATLGENKMEIKGGADGNMVRAMTIHKSKGLEFPVVFLCNIDEGLSKNSGLNAPKLQINKDAGIAINYFDEKAMVAKGNLAFDILKEKNALEDKAEAMRLFYVALTRPKNHIILTGCKKSGDLTPKSPFKVNSFLEWIIVAAQNNEKIESAITIHSDEVQKADNMQRYTFKNYEGEAIPIIDKYINFVYPHKKAEKASIKYTVTEINKQDGKKIDYFEEEESYVGDEISTTFDRAKRGTNYHKILELIDFDCKSKEQVADAINLMVEGGILLQEEVAEIDIDEIVGILNSYVIDYARQNKYYKELEFNMYAKASEVMDTDIEDEVFVQGTIDLLICGKEVWVVDYKKSNEPENVLKERYKKQLQLYAKAVEEGIGRKPDKAMLVVIGSGKVIEIDI